MKNPAPDRTRRLLPLLILASLASPASTASAGTGVWTSGGPSGGSINALAVNPANAAVLYAGTNGGGVFKSTDSGASWAAANTGLVGLSVTALAIDPTLPSRLYAGTSGGVFKSNDAGGTWTAVNTGLTYVYSLAIDPTLPSTLYAVAFPGVFKSTDAGSTWIAVNTGLTNQYVEVVTIDPVTPATLYAGTVGPSVFKSTSAGGTWFMAGLNDPWGYGSVHALTVDPATPTTVYAATDYGLARSTDGGNSWTAIRTGLTDQVVTALAVDPAAGGTLYAATHGGVLRSGDGGSTWSAVNAGLPDLKVRTLALGSNAETTVYAGLSNGVWQLTAPPGGASFLLPATAHARGASGAFYTTNVSVANTGSAPASFQMKFLGHDQDGSAGPEQTFSLEAGRSVTTFDVLGTVFGQTSNFGAIRITSDSPNLVVVSVTSTSGFGGTLSQTVPAIRSSDLIPTGVSRSILNIRDGDGFRTNLVLASNAAVPTSVEVSLVSPEGVALATRSYAVPPRGMTQINRVVRDLGVPGPVTGARIVLSSSTAGAAFTAFASVIDETTNDPTAIEAR